MPLTNIETFGLFTAGYMIGKYLFAGFESLLSTYALNNFYRQVEEKNGSDSWPEFYSHILYFSITFLGLSLIGIDIIVPFILTNEYSQAKDFVFVGLLCEFFRVVGINSNIAAQYTLKPMIVIKPLIVTLVMHLLCILLLIYIIDFNLFHYNIILPLTFCLYIFLFFISINRYAGLKIINNTRTIIIQTLLILIVLGIDHIIVKVGP